MSELYTKLARVYHEMYLGIFDYKQEFENFHLLLSNSSVRRVLEVGCGSGNMAGFFLNHGYDYLGLDLSKEIIDIAKEQTPEAHFIVGDMRNMKFEKSFGAVIISGRSFTHLTTNDDVFQALNSIHDCLAPNGILIFDNFNARKIIQVNNKEFTQAVRYKTKQYIRTSHKSPDFKSGWTENWHSKYIIQEEGKADEILEDQTIIRSFIPEEINLFLKLCNFEVASIMHDGNTFMHVAVRK